MTAPASPPVAVGVDAVEWAIEGLREVHNDMTPSRLERCDSDGHAMRIDAAIKVIRALASPVSGDGSLQAEDRPSVPTEREVRLVLAARAVAFGDGPDREAIKELDGASEAYAADVPWDDEPQANDSCGGCGESNPANRCIGCMHVFSPPPAASRSPGMETLQASECTKHGEGDQ